MGKKNLNQKFPKFGESTSVQIQEVCKFQAGQILRKLHPNFSKPKLKENSEINQRKKIHYFQKNKDSKTADVSFETMETIK